MTTFRRSTVATAPAKEDPLSLAGIVELLTDPVTMSGAPGFAPKMYFSTTAFISARRHFQSERLDMVVPSSLVKRFGS